MNSANDAGKPVPGNVIVGVLIIVATAIVAAVIVINARVTYRLELEPPAQYNHPYARRVDERVMPVAEVRTLCRSVGASGRFVACAWVSNGTCHIVLPSDERAPVRLTGDTKPPIAMVGRPAIPTDR